MASSTWPRVVVVVGHILSHLTSTKTVPWSSRIWPVKPPTLRLQTRFEVWLGSRKKTRSEGKGWRNDPWVLLNYLSNSWDEDGAWNLLSSLQGEWMEPKETKWAHGPVYWLNSLHRSDRPVVVSYNLLIVVKILCNLLYFLGGSKKREKAFFVLFRPVM